VSLNLDAVNQWWFLAVVPAAILLFAILGAGGGTAGLRHWAKLNALSLTVVERRRWNKGPFAFRTGKAGQVYFFTAVNAAGKSRDGYARVKPPLLALFSDTVKIEWDPKGWG
jgi:hypothetical protein